MTTQPPDPDIPQLLAELQSGDFVSRVEVVKALGAAKVDTAEVVKALKWAAETDASAYVREAALRALTALGVAVGDLKAYVAPTSTGKPLTRNEKIGALAIGFIGWNLFSGVWLLISFLGLYDLAKIVLLYGLLVLTNLIVLIVLAFKRRWVALGMLSALVLNAIVTPVADGRGFDCGFACIYSIIFPFWLWYPLAYALAQF